ncbi:MAG: aconitase family protein [Desulfobacterales bacterium]
MSGTGPGAAYKRFFDIGRNGVCHAIFPEKGFVRPGYTIIMGDSHTCTHGAFGAFAAGVGTTDLEVGILKGVCAFQYPKTIKIEVTGTLRPGVFAKDVILSVIGRLGVNGATNKVMEFAGPVIDEMTMEARMTLCNMAIEAGEPAAFVIRTGPRWTISGRLFQGNMHQKRRLWQHFRCSVRTLTQCMKM